MSFIAPLGDGLRRVARAPMVLAGAAVLTAAVALPPALLLREASPAALREDPAADGPVAGGLATGDTAPDNPAAGDTEPRCIPLHWWRFAHDVYPVGAGPCAPPGEADAPLAHLRGLLDDEGPDPALAAVVVAYLAAWTLFSAGAIDRYARDRPTRGAGFFAACGVYGPRLLRLALVAGVAYWTLFRAVHPWLVGAAPPGGGVPPAAMLRYLGFGLLLTLVGLVFDYARVRAVVEDRRSMVGALLAGWRFVRRRPAACLGLYAANGAVVAAVVGVWAITSPDISTGVSMGWAFLAGQVYVAARLAAKLFFYATEVAYFQSRLAHAGYVAAPAPAWPESASAEALGRLVEGAQPPRASPSP